MHATSASTRARPNWLARAILCGFVASILMLFTFVLAYGVAQFLGGLQLTDRRGADALRQMFHALANNVVIDLARPNLYAALAIHLAVGLLFAALYARYAEPRLSGPGWLRGAWFSLLPWLLSVAVFLPLVGGGPFGFGIGAGPLPMLGNLVLHLVYGISLGALYGPWGDLVTDSSFHSPTGDDLPGMERSERAAAVGTLSGLLVGVLVGLFGAAAAGMSPEQAFLGMHPLVFLVASALLGGSLGALVGSFTGLAEASP